jgi:hypothetical protein
MKSEPTLETSSVSNIPETVKSAQHTSRNESTSHRLLDADAARFAVLSCNIRRTDDMILPSHKGNNKSRKSLSEDKR